MFFATADPTCITQARNQAKAAALGLGFSKQSLPGVGFHSFGLAKPMPSEQLCGNSEGSVPQTPAARAVAVNGLGHVAQRNLANDQRTAAAPPAIVTAAALTSGDCKRLEAASARICKSELPASVLNGLLERDAGNRISINA